MRRAAATVLALRVVYGAALVAAPASLTRRWLGETAHHPGGGVALRALGAREVVIHAGALLAAARGEPLRPWLAGSVAGDLTDVAATVAARSGLPPKAAPATAAVAGGSALVSVLVAAALDE